MTTPIDQILCGDTRDVLGTLPDASVHCCVTSPPYWGLRDYGTASWVGGDAGCDHRAPATGGAIKGSGLVGTGNRSAYSADGQYRSTCGKCGATRVDSQIGLEQTPEQYVAQMVQVFREVRRVLRDDGTCWINLGDSYASSQSNNGGYSDKSTLVGFSHANTKGRQANNSGERRHLEHGLKPKDLVGIPWRVAFALQADGWYLRQDIIWAKPNPMPESVKDRCTKAHEYVFLLTKSQRYWYDAEAVSEASVSGPDRRLRSSTFAKVGTQGGHARGSEYVESDGTRNRRSVWSIATQPYRGAHFAVMPQKLVEPCILAGCPEGGTVLDPFSGSGTTSVVAQRLGRHYIGIDLNPAYCEMARGRLTQPVLPMGAT